MLGTRSFRELRAAVLPGGSSSSNAVGKGRGEGEGDQRKVPPDAADGAEVTSGLAGGGHPAGARQAAPLPERNAESCQDGLISGPDIVLDSALRYRCVCCG